jgi:hypothetical protein
MKISLTLILTTALLYNGFQNGIYRMGDQKPLLHWPQNARQAVGPGTAAGRYLGGTAAQAAYRRDLPSRLYG